MTTRHRFAATHALAALLLSSGCGRDHPIVCVAEGTPISTSRGLVPIEALIVSDEVRSVDPATGTSVSGRVVAISSASRECLALRNDTGEVLVLTAEHPVYSPGMNGYVPAADWFMHPTNRTLRWHEGRLTASSLTGPPVRVGRRKVFDLTVESPFHNFVAAGFLVHNKTPPFSYPSRDNPIGVVSALAMSWVRQDIVELDLLVLPDDFLFRFAAGDSMNGSPPGWSWEDERAAADSIFRDNRVSIGAVRFDIGEVVTPAPEDSAPAGTVKVAVSHVAVNISIATHDGYADTYRVIDHNAEFYLRTDPSDLENGVPSWKIVEWRDGAAGAGMSRAGEEQVTWGAIKWLFSSGRAAGLARAVPPPLQIQAVAAEAGQQITVEMHSAKAVVKVASPSGIGSAEVTLKAGAWPADVVVQLQLKGLEELRFTYGGTTVVSSVASYGRNEVRESLSTEAVSAAQLLSPESPYWMNVAIVSPATTSGGQVPLADGYFEVTVPAAFLEGDHPAFTIAWVDFYR